MIFEFGEKTYLLIQYTWVDNLNDKNLNSNEVQIKDWIRGKSKCDLIVDSYVMVGFEASTCLTFSSYNNSALSRTKVKHIQFRGQYHNVELPFFYVL